MSYNTPSQILVATRSVTSSLAAQGRVEFFGNQTTATAPDFHTLGRGGALENVDADVAIFNAYVKLAHPVLTVANADATETYNRIADVKEARSWILETYLADTLVDARPIHCLPHSGILILGNQGAKGGTTQSDGQGDTMTAENAGAPWSFPRIKWPRGATLKAMILNPYAAYTIVGTGGLVIEVGYQIGPREAS